MCLEDWAKQRMKQVNDGEIDRDQTIEHFAVPCKDINLLLGTMRKQRAC